MIYQMLDKSTWKLHLFIQMFMGWLPNVTVYMWNDAFKKTIKHQWERCMYALASCL